jgi:hypothetical protein
MTFRPMNVTGSRSTIGLRDGEPLAMGAALARVACCRTTGAPVQCGIQEHSRSLPDWKRRAIAGGKMAS